MTYYFKESSFLNSCSYDEEKKELTIEFSNGKTYLYENVDKQVYDNFVIAPSAGGYFQKIKNTLKVKSDE